MLPSKVLLNSGNVKQLRYDYSDKKGSYCSVGLINSRRHKRHSANIHQLNDFLIYMNDSAHMSFGEIGRVLEAAGL